MTHLPTAASDLLAELAPLFSMTEQAMGFVPNSMKTMAHLPQLPVALALLVQAANGADLRPLLARFAEQAPASVPADDLLPATHTQLAAFATSVAAGCRYCQAHTAHTGHRRGAQEAQYAALLDYETSALFTAAERAIVGFALAAGQQPNAVTAEHYDVLKEHFTTVQIVQLAATVSTFGFLNRWNDTLATTLETMPRSFAGDALRTLGWEAGKHAEA
ncbi:MAG: carboxymuconolactone decarboxylase family protein [Pseudomonadota bacterium]